MANDTGFTLQNGEEILATFGTLLLTNRRVVCVEREVHIFKLIGGDNTYNIIDLPSVCQAQGGEYISILRMIGIILLGLVIFKLDVVIDLLQTFSMRPLIGRSASVRVDSPAGHVSFLAASGAASDVEAARAFIVKLLETKSQLR